MHLYNVAKREKEHLNVLETSNDLPSYDRKRYAIAPDLIRGSTPQPPQEPSAPEKKNTLRNRLIGAGVIASLAISGAIVGISASNKGEKAPEATTTSAPATPEATANPVDTTEVFTVQSLEIPSSSSPEQIATAFSDRLTKYAMASANPKTYKERLAYQGGTSNQFAIEHAEKNAAIFNEAIFVNGFESDPSMLKYADAWKSISISVTEDYLITYDSNDPQDKEPFAISSTPKSGSEKILSQDASSITMEFTITDHNNADKNRIGSQYDPGVVSKNGEDSVFTATFNAVGGNYKVSALNVVTLAK